MKRAWFVMLVSAFTNGAITTLSGIVTVWSMPPGPDGGGPHWTATMILVPVGLGALVAFRYIAGQVKMTPEITAELLGRPVIVTTITPETPTSPAEVVTKGPGATVIERHLNLPPQPMPVGGPPVAPPVPPGLAEAVREEVARQMAAAKPRPAR